MSSTAEQTVTHHLIEQYFEAFNRQDPEALLSLLDENVRHDVNEGPTEIGVAKFRVFKKHMDECYHEVISDLVIMVNGTRGAAEFTCTGTYMKTDGSLPEARGQRYTIPAVAIFEVHNGKITRVTSYYSLVAWLQAVTVGA